ncbi:MAG: hypothetical protein ABEL51_06535 [Salinibacter sp.]
MPLNPRRTPGLPQAIPAYRALLKTAKLDVAPWPSPEQLQTYRDRADPKDLVHLVEVSMADCDVLVTHNTRDYAPEAGTIGIPTPGGLLKRVRQPSAELLQI